jgi:hypothetical protein
MCEYWSKMVIRISRYGDPTNMCSRLLTQKGSHANYLVDTISLLWAARFNEHVAPLMTYLCCCKNIVFFFSVEMCGYGKYNIYVCVLTDSSPTVCAKLTFCFPPVEHLSWSDGTWILQCRVSEQQYCPLCIVFHSEKGLLKKAGIHWRT